MTPWVPSSSNRWWTPSPKAGGRYPDTTQFEPGDLLLFKPTAPSATQQLIILGQKRLEFDDHSAGFTHAAIYLDSDCFICEALLDRGVQVSSLESSVPSSTIMLRRLRGRGFAVARAVLKYLDASYDKGTIGRLATAAFLRSGLPRQEFGEQAFICSTLYSRAVMAACPGEPMNFNPTPDTVVVPATLASSPMLETIPFDWRSASA